MNAQNPIPKIKYEAIVQMAETLNSQFRHNSYEYLDWSGTITENNQVSVKYEGDRLYLQTRWSNINLTPDIINNINILNKLIIELNNKKLTI